MANDSWNPAQYEKFKNERAEPFWDLTALIDRNSSLSCAIDLGCGTGELTAHLCQHLMVKEMTGIDSSPQMLEKAKKFENLGLHFKKGDIETFLEPNRYDLIFSNAAIQWCEDHEKIFRNCQESLKPGGQLAIQVPMNHDYPTHVIASELAPTPRTYPLLTLEEYSKLLYRLGFSEQKVLLRVYAHILPSREDVTEWVKGTLLTFIQAQMSRDEYDLWLAEYRKVLFEILPDERPFLYPFKRLLLWARK